MSLSFVVTLIAAYAFAAEYNPVSVVSGAIAYLEFSVKSDVGKFVARLGSVILAIVPALFIPICFKKIKKNDGTEDRVLTIFGWILFGLAASTMILGILGSITITEDYAKAGGPGKETFFIEQSLQNFKVLVNFSLQVSVVFLGSLVGVKEFNHLIKAGG